MSDRYDALTVREDKNGKAYFTKLGAMFANKSGDGFTLVLDAVPASNEGQYRILLKVPQPRDGQAAGRGTNNKFATDDLDDDIAF